VSNSFYTHCITAGNNILFRGIIDGKRIKRRIQYKPKLYSPSQTPTRWKTLQGGHLQQIEFDSIKDCQEFKSQYEKVGNFPIYGDIQHHYAFISETFKGDISWDQSKLVIAYIDIEVGSEHGFPEPAKASEPVTAITIHVGGLFHVFACGDFDVNKCVELSPETRNAIRYFQCADEKDLIRQFIACWVSFSPDITTGWNTNEFDWPYIINRMERLFMGADGEDLIRKLSPWDWVRERHAGIRGKEVQFYDIVGVSMIDYIELYQKYGPQHKQESYKLDYIASEEIGTQKIDYSEYEDLYSLYKRNHQLFIEYNIRDVELVMKIEAKNRLLELAMTLAYDSKVNYDDVFGQVKMWDVIIYNHLLKKGIQIPPRKDTSKRKQFEGAYVKEPRAGMYNWVVSFDFTSLYPHLIMMYNISPETLIEPVDYSPGLELWMDANKRSISVETMLSGNLDLGPLKQHNVTITPNGQLFNRAKHGFLAEIMDTMYQDRAKYKKLMKQATAELEHADETQKAAIESRITRYNNLQNTKKICLNSAFGAAGNPGFRYFDVRLAEAITLSAQLSVIWIQQEINKYINGLIKSKGDYVIASDTDSVYVTFERLLRKLLGPKLDTMPTIETIRYIDKMCQQVIGPKIDGFCKALGDYVNCYDQKLDMKREAIADKAIWLKKKHYMITVWNNEGLEYTKPKLKIVGMQAIKSSTPGVCRKRIKEAFELIMSKDQSALREYVNTFRDEFMKLPVQDIAFPSGMNGLNEYDGGDKAIYKIKTPVHVKGALIYNHWLEEHKLTNKYQSIKDGEKLKFVYLKEPNFIQSPVISFTTLIPPEFGLDKYIDYPEMFQKTFVNQIEKVTSAIDWKLEETSSLENLFG